MRSKINMSQVWKDAVAANAKVGNAGALVSLSDLTMIQPMTAGMTNINFYVNANQANITPNEVRLQQTDEFVITRLGFFLYGSIGTLTGPAGTLSNEYWTYAPYQLAKVFIGVRPAWDSGQLLMNFNGTDFVKGWTTNKHMVIPRTQDSNFTTPQAATLASKVLGEDGFEDMEPTIRISGSKNNKLTITWPNGLTPVVNYSYTTEAADNVFININNVALVLKGLLNQNVATILG